MAKAVTGAVEIAAGLIILASPLGGALGALWLPLVMSGVSMEIAEISTLFAGNSGVTSTIRQSAAPRRVIYGTQRVGGVEIYESTTGGSKDQYNMVIVYAAHEITAFGAMYLDGRRIYFTGTDPDFTVRNGVGFGGGGNGQTYTGPDGQQYSFANAISGHRGVYVIPRFGDQPFGDYITGLTANDPVWNTYVAPDGSRDYPSVMDCAYCYVKVEYNADDFQQKPDIKATIQGKKVFDPRTGLTAYSENWALILADIITNADYGLGSAVNQDQLIAAANICDEAVAVNGTGTLEYESRYSCHYTWTMDKGVGEVLNDILAGAAGRLSYIEGEWYIFPGTFVGPSATFTSDSLLAAPTWSSQRKFRDKVNRVQGTYIAPNYPYNVAGNGYDNTTLTQNNFAFGFQPCSYPTFACDPRHGYAVDQYLAEDKGVELVQTLDLSSVLSVGQAQRVAKINLLRNRQQGSGTLVLGPEALILQPNDTFLMTYPKRGWYDKLLEVTEMNIAVQPNGDGIPEIRVTLSVQETASSVYDWFETDELNLHDIEVAPSSGRSTTAPPTNLQLSSSAATALTQPDGTVQPRIKVTWDVPADVRVTGIEIRWRYTGDTGWNDGGSVSAASTTSYLPAVAGKQYDVEIRSVRPGASSVWVELDGFTAGLVLSTLSKDGYGIGSLVAEAYSDGTAAIHCQPFTANVGQLALPIFPSGEVVLSSLQQQRLYYVYYDDPTYAGGDVTPVATTDPSTIYGVQGRFLIDKITTPAFVTAGSGRYVPTQYVDSGTRTTISGDAAYDGDSTTAASVSANARRNYADPGTSSSGLCTWSGFPPIGLSSPMTLYVDCSLTTGNGSARVYATFGGSSYDLATQSGTGSAGEAVYTLTLPAGTSLGTLTVTAEATPGADPGYDPSVPSTAKWSSIASINVFEMYVAN